MTAVYTCIAGMKEHLNYLARELNIIAISSILISQGMGTLFILLVEAMNCCFGMLVQASKSHLEPPPPEIKSGQPGM